MLGSSPRGGFKLELGSASGRWHACGVDCSGPPSCQACSGPCSLLSVVVWVQTDPALHSWVSMVDKQKQLWAAKAGEWQGLAVSLPALHSRLCFLSDSDYTALLWCPLDSITCSGHWYLVCGQKEERLKGLDCRKLPAGPGWTEGQCLRGRHKRVT